MSSTKIEEVHKKIGKTVNEASEVVQDRVEQKFDEVIDRLKDEKDRLEIELRHEYRNARRYVRANPERGLGIALAAGIVIGILLGRSTK